MQKHKITKKSVKSLILYFVFSEIMLLAVSSKAALSQSVAYLSQQQNDKFYLRHCTHQRWQQSTYHV